MCWAMWSALLAEAQNFEEKGRAVVLGQLTTDPIFRWLQTVEHHQPWDLFWPNYTSMAWPCNSLVCSFCMVYRLTTMFVSKRLQSKKCWIETRNHQMAFRFRPHLKKVRSGFAHMENLNIKLELFRPYLIMAGLPAQLKHAETSSGTPKVTKSFLLLTAHMMKFLGLNMNHHFDWWTTNCFHPGTNSRASASHSTPFTSSATLPFEA